MLVRTALVVLSLTVLSTPTYAADNVENAEATAGAVPSVALAVDAADGRRPAALPMLYSGLIALQAFDVYSTRRGLAAGAQEGNSLMRGIAGNTATFWAVKAGTTAATIWATERMWKKNRVGAIVTMVAVNSVMASVAARNASVLKTIR